MQCKYALRSGAKLAFGLALALPSPLLFADSFVRTNLVSDGCATCPSASATDLNLKNPWGVSFTPTSPFWISDQASGMTTLYNGAGNQITPPSPITIPPGTPPATGPTGQVFNSTSGFVLPNGHPAAFLFDTLNGTIAGWNGSAAAVNVPNVSTPGAVYTGLALASAGGSNYLYAADSTGQIRVFDSTFAAVTLPGNFTDPHSVAGFVPFNIQLIGSDLYVTYAQLTPMGTGLPGGYVDAFDTSGNFVRRVATGGALYAPWGLTLAPAGFGSFANDLLVGNFGNGEILAYNPTTDAFLGTLDGANGQPIVNDFLWALETRTGGPNVNTNAVYFTAGINNQQDGLFGELTSIPEPGMLIPIGFGLAGIGLFSRYRRRRAR